LKWKNALTGVCRQRLYSTGNPCSRPTVAEAGVKPQRPEGARHSAGLTLVFASNTLSCEQQTPSPRKDDQKIPLTVITVSTTTIRLTL
jgi:hypothetical protein